MRVASLTEGARPKRTKRLRFFRGFSFINYCVSVIMIFFSYILVNFLSARTLDVLTCRWVEITQLLFFVKAARTFCFLCLVHVFCL